MRAGTTAVIGVSLSGLLVAAAVSSGALRGLANAPPPGSPKPAQLEATDRARIAGNFGKLALSFIENRGQTDQRVAYYVQSPGRSLYFTEGGHALRLSKGKGEEARAHTVMVELVDAATQRVEGRQRAPGVVSYFKGPKKQWKAGVPTHARIGYVQPWPGIDLAYDGSGGKLESIYTVAPHASPDQIRLRYSGQESLTLDAGGNLVYSTSVGEVQETAPIAYQEIGGIRIPVETRYALLDERTVSFQVASYNPAHALVIDPTLVYAGYIGGFDFDSAGSIAVDSAGNAYVTGTTGFNPLNFPVTVGPDLTYNGGGHDTFVAKVNASGSALVYAGYIGGSGDDFARGIAVDSAGNAYVTGHTSSTESSFPVLSGPDLTHNGGLLDDGEGGFVAGYDAFVAKVNADGSALLYAGYIGGDSGSESASSIAVDSAGNAYVAGGTGSTETTFPVLGGPDLTHNGDLDPFVAKVNADGSALIYAGYIGGDSGIESALGIAVDSAGNAYVAGHTDSTETTFPVIGGPDLTHNGLGDAFVAKVNPDGSALIYAGYIGGDGHDSANGVAVDSAGNAYVAGHAGSTETTFPVMSGPDLTYNYGVYDAYVAKVNADGSALVYAGYVGGSGTDVARDIAVDNAGNAYVAGETSSTETTFPGLGGPDLVYNGDGDAFVAKVNADGSALVYAGYVGGSCPCYVLGSGIDVADGIAVDSAGDAYVAGRTSSIEESFPVTVGPDLTHNSFYENGDVGYDAFVAKITEADITPDAFIFQDQTDVAVDSETTSNAVTITGLDATAPISVAGGTYSVNSGAFTSAVGAVSNGQMVRVRHTSSAGFSTATNTVLTVGGVSDTFTSTTVSPPPDSVPDAFTFIDQSGVTRDTQVTSASVTITGINQATDISVTGGLYSIDNGPFVSASGTVTNGQMVRVRHTSSAGFSTATNTVLTVGGVSDTFASTTVSAPPSGGGGSGGSPSLPLLVGLAGLLGFRRLINR